MPPQLSGIMVDLEVILESGCVTLVRCGVKSEGSVTDEPSGESMPDGSKPDPRRDLFELSVLFLQRGKRDVLLIEEVSDLGNNMFAAHRESMARIGATTRSSDWAGSISQHSG